MVLLALQEYRVEMAPMDDREWMVLWATPVETDRRVKMVTPDRRVQLAPQVSMVFPVYKDKKVLKEKKENQAKKVVC